jgi:radical SAM protein with 4Fe4S-binding SPASM domain
MSLAPAPSQPPRPALPSHVQIEVTSACNLKCRMCLVRYAPPVNKAEGAIPYDVFTRIVDENPNLERVTLQGLGEPLLHPRIVDMVRYLAERGIRCGFNTNATLLTPRRARALVDAGIGWLHVSLDGATPDVYESVRDGARFDDAVRNLRALVAAKRERGGDAPHVEVAFVAMRRNLDDLPGLVRLVADIGGVARIRVQNLSHTFDDTDPAGRYAEIREFAADEALFGGADRECVERVFAEASTLADSLGVTLRLPSTDTVPPVRRPGCSWPFEAAYVTSRGRVQPCCMVMGDDRVTLGDLHTQSFAQVWSSPGYDEFRAGLLDGDPPAVCRGCSMYRGVF